MILVDAFTVGERAPTRVEEPDDALAAAATLRAAAQAGAAVVAFGGGTLQTIGNAPRRYDVALSLRRLDRIVQYDPRDLTIGVEAGATLESVTSALAQNGQFIPFDAPLPGRATVGGTLAAGWSGPRRVTHGRLRDLLIGSTVALTDGTLASAGGMVVKNVTGYDMSKAYVGSLGTLGIIVRANFKALPRAAVRRLAVAPLSDESRERAVAAAAHLAVEPTAALIVNGFAGRTPRVRDEDARLIVLFEGSQSVIERATRDLRSALGAAGIAQTVLHEQAAADKALQDVVDAYIESVPDRSITYRSTGFASNAWSRALAASTAVREQRQQCDFIADIRTGDVIIRIVGRSAESMAAVLPGIDADIRRILPHATVLAGAAPLRTRIDGWGTPPSTLETMRTLKARFDPGATLAPGRYVGGI